MGTLETLLDECISSPFLAEMLRDAGESPIPASKRARVDLAAKLVRQGAIDFDAVVISGKGVTKDLLADMCMVVGLDPTGKKDELARRLSKWHAESSGGRVGPARADQASKRSSAASDVSDREHAEHQERVATCKRLSVPGIESVTCPQCTWSNTWPPPGGHNQCARCGFSLERARVEHVKAALERFQASGANTRSNTTGPSATSEHGRSAVSTLAAAEREFLEITSSARGDGFFAKIGLPGVGRAADAISGAAGALTASAEAPAVLQVRAAEVENVFTFDEGLPAVGSIYVRHPIDPRRYIHAEHATERIAREKLLAIIEIAGLLGASRVELHLDESSASHRVLDADIAVLGRELGLNLTSLEQGRTSSAWQVNWPRTHRAPSSIPASHEPYLRAMPALGMLARLIHAGRTPENFHEDVEVEFSESQKIAGKLKKIPKLGNLAAQLERQSLASTRWKLRIWFPEPTPTAAHPGAVHPGAPQVAPPPPPYAMPGAPCPTCHAALIWVAQYQRWYCAHCQRYAAS